MTPRKATGSRRNEEAIRRLLGVARKAYLEVTEITELPASYEDACKHNSGDTLADFVVIEIYEVLKGDERSLAELRERAADAIQRAANDLAAVAEALRTAT